MQESFHKKNYRIAIIRLIIHLFILYFLTTEIETFTIVPSDKKIYH